MEAVNRYTISTQVVAEVSVNLLKKAGMPESERRSYGDQTVTQEFRVRGSRLRIPANWPGWQKGIKPDPKTSQFFSMRDLTARAG